MSETRFQFRVDGRAGNSPIRNTWAEAAADAVRAGYASWRKCGIEINFDPTSGGEIARLPGKDAEIASLRAQLDEARAKLKRKKEASAQIEKTATEAWHLIAALPYSSAAGELEEKLRALLSESKT